MCHTQLPWMAVQVILYLTSTPESRQAAAFILGERKRKEWLSLKALDRRLFMFGLKLKWDRCIASPGTDIYMYGIVKSGGRQMAVLVSNACMYFQFFFSGIFATIAFVSGLLAHLFVRYIDESNIFTGPCGTRHIKHRLLLELQVDMEVARTIRPWSQRRNSNRRVRYQYRRPYLVGRARREPTDASHLPNC